MGHCPLIGAFFCPLVFMNAQLDQAFRTSEADSTVIDLMQVQEGRFIEDTLVQW